MAVDLVGPILEEILDRVLVGLDPPPERVSLYSGAAPAWDSCECGQLWVRLVSMEPMTGDPRQNRSLGPCGVLMWRVTIGVGLLRCAATLADDGSAPLPGVLTEETLQMTADLAALSEAITCTIPQVPGLEKMQVGQWEPLGPDGGCVGGEWTIQALVNTCQCP